MGAPINSVSSIRIKIGIDLSTKQIEGYLAKIYLEYADGEALK